MDTFSVWASTDGGLRPSRPLDPFDVVLAMDHPVLRALSDHVPIPSPFVTLEVSERDKVTRSWLANKSLQVAGFDAEDALSQRFSARVGVERWDVASSFFFFMGRPLAFSVEDSSRNPDAARTLWWAYYYALCDHLGTPRNFVRSNETTETFGLPLFEFVSFLLPCRRLWVLETAFEGRSPLVFKYEVKLLEGRVHVSRSQYAERRFDPIRDHERSRTRKKLQMGSSGIESEFYFVSKFSELARQPAGAGVSLQNLGLREDSSYAALSLRSADIEITILTDARNADAAGRLEERKLLHLLQNASRALLERLEFIRHGEIIRSEVRHAIGQEHEGRSVGRVICNPRGKSLTAQMCRKMVAPLRRL